ncbi:MAG: hypothetical protein EOO50_11860 [Flavobacterium sp.]|uniref:hypothetical protein n=1 Tax=Flavobacterium sp. TaxID=239 RepID=UPI0011FEFFE9|nr:hypothetical protein [Flavobacterium sp.]RZJ65954.1 MAG: hypothetical protein EOO50_11860 [Flavobacterium sp.]
MDTQHNHKFDGKEDRNYHQKPFDDVTDNLPQIDETSAKLADKTPQKETSAEDEDSDRDKAEDAAGYVSEINDTDVRDQGDSTKDWDAENSRTGRNK